MTRFTRLSFFVAVVIASIWTAHPKTAHAQDTAKPKSSTDKSGVTTVTRDSVNISVADVQKAAEQLAIAVQEAVRKATEDPAVKVAALKVAMNAVSAAQVVVTEQADTIQRVLDAVAKEIGQVAEQQQKKSRNH
jgi:hypothetical protein